MDKVGLSEHMFNPFVAVHFRKEGEGVRVNVLALFSAADRLACTLQAYRKNDVCEC